MTFDPARAVLDQEPEFNPERATPDVGAPVRAVLKTAVPFKPDDVAEAARLAARYPAPVDTLYRNLADVRVQAAVDAADERLKTSPKLAEHMRTQPFVAKLAHDDVDRLADIEQFVRDVGGAMKAGVFRASRGAAGTFQAGLELVAPVLDPLAGTILPENPLRRAAAGFAELGGAAGETAKAAMPKSDGILMGGFFSGVQSFTQNALALPLAFVNPQAALAMMTAGTGGDSYQDAREKGLPMSQALPFAASQAAIEYATEKLPLGALLKDVKAGAGFLTVLGRQIALEVPGEQIATVLQDLNEWAILNPEKPFSSYLEERPSAAAQTLVATIVGTGGNVTLTKGIEVVIERATRDGVNMQRAGVMGQALEQAMKGAQASALRERSPEVFRQLMTEMSEDGSVYVDAEVLNQLPADVLQQMEGVAEQLQAATPDAPVAVKLADALTLLPGTPAAEVFMQNARSAPDAPSLLEAEAAGKQAAEFLQNEMARVVQEAQDQEAMRASSEAVRQTILGELTATGRYRPAVSDQMATWATAFYTTMASRVGMTPEQFFQRRARLRVLGAPSQQGDAYNASQPGRLDGIEAYHWSMEARPVLSSAFYGTGLKGSAREEIMSYPDQRVRQRLSFYVDKGTGVRPEAGVGGVAHRVRLDNIYDANADPLRLRSGNAREFESKVLDAGFDGYLDRLDGEQPGQVIMLGQRVLQPEVLGPLSRVDAGQRVPALERREAPWTVQASGAPEVLQMRLARMQASPAWGNYELKIEGDQLLARDKGGVFEQKAKEPDSNVKLPKKASATVAVDIRKGERLTGKQKMSIHEVAAFFDKITGKRDFNDPKEQARAVKQIVAELKYQMEREKSGLDWYEDDIKAAFEMTAQVIPSLTESATKRQLFAVVAGLQSPGTLADMNWDIAAQAFLHYEKTGQIPGRNPANGNLWVGGPVSANKAKALEFLNAMVQDLGEQGTVEWLYSEHTVKELNEARKKWSNMGPGVDGKASDMKLGMFAFGPKVGPFVMNINGIHELTIDVWATRSFNRYFGQMTGPGGKIIDAPTEPQRRVAKELFNAAAEQVGIKPYQVQSVLWFFEQQLFNHLGTGSASLSFSDGARKFAERSLSAARRDGEAAALQQGGLTDGRSEPTGDGAGRYAGGSLAPLAGAPTVEGAAGPDPRLVAVAEQYARDNGIPLRRQAEYVKVDVERAKRIAQAYDEMKHDPQAPRVKQAYDDLARQTMAQYQALVNAGYQFWFMDPAADPYQGNPWNAMRDLRANQSMAVFPTAAGFGTGATVNIGLADPNGGQGLSPEVVLSALEAAGVTIKTSAVHASDTEPTLVAELEAPMTPEIATALSQQLGQEAIAQRLGDGSGGLFGPAADKWGTFSNDYFVTIDGQKAASVMNPLLADTGLEWPYGAPDGPTKKVLFNDLFRAVHDAFGHGLEGAGFRAQGEENAWQTHVRLFTGPAVGAITSETRGQNSWLNYGPHGEKNRNAKVEDTVFAEQKTGLMPEWTWTEGRAPDAGALEQSALEQPARGTFNPQTLELVLNPNADLSTFFHETGHFFLEVLADVASQPGAPAQILDDYNKVLGWFGVTPEQWARMTLDQKRPHHERWAESIEQYVMEGKVPNKDLQPLMRRFAAWLKSVYGSIKQFLAQRPDAEQQPLNDDIRRVMDRMLATDEQIAQAEELAGYEFSEEATNEAREKLGKRSMADLKWAVKARDAVIAKLRKDAAAIEKRIRAEVTEEVDQMPEVRAKKAIEALNVDVEFDGKINEWKAARTAAEEGFRKEITDALVAAEESKGTELKGLKKGQFLAKVKAEVNNKVEAKLIEWERANKRPTKAQFASDADMAVIADSFNYESVDAMLQAIDAFDRRDLIDGMTEQRMLEQHGDLIDERAISEAANEAVHNMARQRALASELRTQAELLNPRQATGETDKKGRPITVNALVEAAKQFGANIASRVVVRDLKAKAWQHTAAERRAGKRYQEMTAAGKTLEAVEAKRDQMLNNAAAKALVEAQAEVRKIGEFFKRVTKDNNEKTVEKGRDPDIVNAMRAVLAAYGVETRTTKAAGDYLETLKTSDPETYGVVEPMMAAMLQNAQPMDALTFEQLIGLHEQLEAMWYLAKRSRQLEVDGDLMDIEDAAQDLFTRMEEIGIPDEVPGERGALTRTELLARQWLQQAPALLRRVEQWAEAKDGKFGGPFLRLLFQPVKDAADRYRTDRLVYRRKFQALVDNVAPTFTKGTIDAPELGYVFGRGHNGIGHAELLHAILHTGNESNKRKLLLGRNWATELPDGTLDTSRWDAFLKRMHDTGVLEKAHWDFAQGVWDLMEETKPLAQKAHRDVFGRYFAEVTANPVETPFGTYPGGYVPAQADPLLVQDADLRELIETDKLAMSQAFPSTNRGFTMSRVEYNRPLKLDLRSLPQHIDKVLLFSHMEPAVRGAARLLRQQKVSQPLARIDPAAMGAMLKPWLNRAARQTVETPISADAGLNRMASTIRGRVGMALMFANVSNTLQQITGAFTAAIKVPAADMRRATAQYIANPKRLKESVWALSPYMADRASNEVAVLSDTLEEILINPTTFQRAEQFTRRHGYFLQTAFDNQMSPIIWTAAYNQALRDGMDERMAIRYADGVIRQTQGSTLPEDVSRIETGPAYARLFTQFVGYFNMMANTNATALQQIAQEQGLKKGAGKALYALTLGLMVPLWAAEAIALAFKGGPDDEDDDGYLDDWIASVFGFGTIKGLLAGVPFLGAAAQSVVNRFNDQPADDKFSLSPSVSVLESAAGAPASVYKAIVDDASAQKAVRDASALITVMTGLPAMTAARPLGYLAGVADDRIEPTGPVDAARGLVTGTASPESKQR